MCTLVLLFKFFFYLKTKKNFCFFEDRNQFEFVNNFFFLKHFQLPNNVLKNKMFFRNGIKKTHIVFKRLQIIIELVPLLD